jgi:hypothetical protein
MLAVDERNHSIRHGPARHPLLDDLQPDTGCFRLELRPKLVVPGLIHVGEPAAWRPRLNPEPQNGIRIAQEVGALRLANPARRCTAVRNRHAPSRCLAPP